LGRGVSVTSTQRHTDHRADGGAHHQQRDTHNEQRVTDFVKEFWRALGRTIKTPIKARATNDPITAPSPGRPVTVRVSGRRDGSAERGILTTCLWQANRPRSSAVLRRTIAGLGGCLRPWSSHDPRRGWGLRTSAPSDVVQHPGTSRNGRLTPGLASALQAPLGQVHGRRVERLRCAPPTVRPPRGVCPDKAQRSGLSRCTGAVVRARPGSGVC
jgi:hypothetical protein